MENKFELRSITGGIGKKYICLISNNDEEQIKESDIDIYYYLKLNNYLKVKALSYEVILAYALLEEIFPERQELTSFIYKSLLGKNYSFFKEYRPMGIKIK